MPPCRGLGAELDPIELQRAGLRSFVAQALHDVGQFGGDAFMVVAIHHNLIRTRSPISDREMSAQCDRPNFERLYAEHANALFGFLMYRTGDRGLAEDVVADTFERALRARRGFDRRRGSEKTWLYAIALNRLRDQARRAGAEERAREPLRCRRRRARRCGGDGAGRGAPDRGGGARGAVGRGARGDRPALRRRAHVKEIARLTGEPMTTVEGRVYRALRKLKDSLEPEA